MKKILSVMLVFVIALIMFGCEDVAYVANRTYTTNQITTVEMTENGIWEERIESLDFLIVEVTRRYDGINLEYKYQLKTLDDTIGTRFYKESNDLLSVGEIGLVIEFEDETSILIDID